MQTRLFPFIALSLSLAACYYAPDLKYQTAGSVIGGMGVGMTLVEKTSPMLSVAGGVIGGSMLGSNIGQQFDNQSPFMKEDPLTAPVRRPFYQVLRPTLHYQCYKTGKIYYNYSNQLPRVAVNSPIVNQLDR